jgi:hypothetical protein
MEEKIYQKLIAGLKNSPLSDRTIRSKAQRMAKKITTDEQLTEDVVNEAIEDLKELGGQLNKDVADKVKEQVEKLPKPPAPPVSPTPPIFNEPDKDLVKRIADVEAMLKETQRQLKKERLLEQTKTLLMAQNANKDYILRNVLAKVAVTEDDTAETLATKCIPLYDKEYKEAYGEGAIPRNANGDNGAAAEAKRAQLLEFKKSKETKK